MLCYALKGPVPPQPHQAAPHWDSTLGPPHRLLVGTGMKEHIQAQGKALPCPRCYQLAALQHEAVGPARLS